MSLLSRLSFVVLLGIPIGQSESIFASSTAGFETAEEEESVSLLASGRGRPWINLSDGRNLSAANGGWTGRFASLALQSQPVSLVGGDLDGDGAGDLICGYRSPGGGALVVFPGNLDARFPTSASAYRRRLEGTFTDEPFSRPAAVIEVPAVPELIVSGDFDADRRLDVVVAARGSEVLYWLAGDGRGALGSPQLVELPGLMTGLTSGDVNRRDGLDDLLVGVEGADQAWVLVFSSAKGAFSAPPASLPVTEPPEHLTVAQLNREHPVDFAMAAGNTVRIVSGWDESAEDASIVTAADRLDEYPFPSRVVGLEAGDFVGSDRLDLGVLLEDGVLHVLEQLDDGIIEVEPIDSGFPPSTRSLMGGEADENLFPRLLRSRISAVPKADLVLFAPGLPEIRVVVPHLARRSLELSQASEPVVSLDYLGGLASVLPMRLNDDALDDLVFLGQGSRLLSVATSEPLRTYVVDSDRNDLDADLSDNVCDIRHPEGKCTLWAAIQNVNKNDGLSKIVICQTQSWEPENDFECWYPPRSIHWFSSAATVNQPIVFDGAIAPSVPDGPPGKIRLVSFGGGDEADVTGFILKGGNSTIRNVSMGPSFDGGAIILQAGDNNEIQDSWIGQSNENQIFGVKTEDSSDNTIGVASGASPSAEVGPNLINGNRGGPGVAIASGLRNRVCGNVVASNEDGIYLGPDSEEATICDNSIRSNFGYGVHSAGSNHVIRKNTIGEEEASNYSGGVFVEGDSNLIEENRMAYNGRSWEPTVGGIGVSLEAEGARISNNRIFSNYGLGIDIGRDGVTPNRLDDGVVGYPELTLSSDETQVSVRFQGEPGETYDFEFFTNSECDPSGFGEGEERFAVRSSLSSSDGLIEFDIGVSPPGFITATAIEAMSGSTSEFSACAAPKDALVVNSVGDKENREEVAGCDTGEKITRNGSQEPECTLRAAIESINRMAGLEGRVSIEFDIPGPGPYSIQVGLESGKALPPVEYPVELDATTQDGFADSPVVELNGITAGEEAIGLDLRGGDSRIRGLVINRFQGHGIMLSGKGGNLVSKNWVGTSLSGQKPLFNEGWGLRIEDIPDNTVRDNVISGNRGGGVYITGFEAENIQLKGNIIGADKDGGCVLQDDPSLGLSCALGNGRMSGPGGIRTLQTGKLVIGGPSREEGNVISGNFGEGISVRNCSEVIVEGNRVGTGRSGVAAIPNLSDGMYLHGVTKVRIGGLEHDRWTCNRSCNLVSSNRGNGIVLDGLEGVLASQSVAVQGNFIGTDVSGAVDRGNQMNGVLVKATNGCYVGGPQEGAGNLISGNDENGITLAGYYLDAGYDIPHTRLNQVEGNRIGTDAANQSLLPNEAFGIALVRPALQNYIGRNTVIHKGKGGIYLHEDAKQNRVQGNFFGMDYGPLSEGGGGQTGPASLCQGTGILVESEANEIGGGPEFSSVTGNTVAYNSGPGICLGNSGNSVRANQIFSNRVGVYASPLSDQNAILTNSIYGNKFHGIDLRGGNKNQSAPTLMSALQDPTISETPVVEGRFRAPDSSPSTLQFFSSPDCETYGAGVRFIGEIQELPGRFHFVSSEDVGSWKTITATVTDPAGNTSEFSQCISVQEDNDGDGSPAVRDKDDSDATRATTEGGLEIESNSGEPIRIEPAPPIEPPVGFNLLSDPGVGTLNQGGGGGTYGSGTAYLALEPGGSAVLTLYLPEGKTATTYLNFGPTPDDPEPHWYEFLYDGTTGAEILQDRILLHFVDGERGDHDLLANGSISFFGAPATLADLYFPFYQAGKGTFVGFAVSNFSEGPANVEFAGLDPEGEDLPVNNNPAAVTLDSQTQIAQLGHEIFGTEASADQFGWVVMDTDNPELGSFFQFGGTNQLDGSVAFSRQSKRFYFTRVYEGATSFRGQPAETLLAIANPNSDSVTVKLTLVDSALLKPSEITRVIPARGLLTEIVSAIFEIQGASGGYIEVEVAKGEGAVGFELIRLPQHQTVIGLNASVATETTRLFSAQLASAANIYTSLKLLNTSQQERSVIVTAVGEDGELLAEQTVLHLVPGESGEWDARDLFSPGSTAGSGGPGTDRTATAPLVGSLKLTAEGPGVVGDVTFGDPVGFTYAAALPLQTRPFKEAIFSQVANLTTFFTGLALYNPGSEDAEVTIEVFDSTGVKTGSVEITLEPGTRISDLVASLVPDTMGQVRGYIVIRSSAGIVAQQLFADFKLNLMSAVPPTTIR